MENKGGVILIDKNQSMKYSTIGRYILKACLVCGLLTGFSSSFHTRLLKLAIPYKICFKGKDC